LAGLLDAADEGAEGPDGFVLVADEVLDEGGVGPEGVGGAGGVVVLGGELEGGEDGGLQGGGQVEEEDVCAGCGGVPVDEDVELEPAVVVLVFVLEDLDEEACPCYWDVRLG
jgi:hypothetical protein